MTVQRVSKVQWFGARVSGFQKVWFKGHIRELQDLGRFQKRFRSISGCFKWFQSTTAKALVLEPL